MNAIERSLTHAQYEIAKCPKLALVVFRKYYVIKTLVVAGSRRLCVVTAVAV